MHSLYPFIPPPLLPMPSNDPNQKPPTLKELLLLIFLVIVLVIVLFFIMDVVADWLADDKKTLYKVLKEHLHHARDLIRYRLI